MVEHAFTPQIIEVLRNHFGDRAQSVYRASPLLQYLNLKTRSANRGSKARGAFANHYAIYVLVEDYIRGGFHQHADYSRYEGARFTDLMVRQRELPFGSKLQNHALNSRLNDEFGKFFPTVDVVPIMRDRSTNRYWFNEALLLVDEDEPVNIAEAVIEIVDLYVAAKLGAFEQFIATCDELSEVQHKDQTTVREFILGLVQPHVDARVFEIVSYAILKSHYDEKILFWGWAAADLRQDNLVLYKTGRTNANDGGIDFVMKPLGRFFQVTESLDVNKYFLDIDKIQRYPLTFVIKSADAVADLQAEMRTQAMRKYGVDKVVDAYMDCIEEIINIPELTERFEQIAAKGRVADVLRNHAAEQARV
jgi:hypothetical protein